MLWKSISLKIYGLRDPSRFLEKQLDLLVYQLLELLVSNGPLGRILPGYQLEYLLPGGIQLAMQALGMNEALQLKVAFGAKLVLLHPLAELRGGLPD